MIKTKEKLIESLLRKGIKIATEQNEAKLVSITKEINKTDPISFFEAAKATKKDRIFWGSSVDDFYIVGVGNAFEITGKNPRFENTGKQWSNIVENAITHNPYKEIGTGVLALGGMSFDPKKKKSSLWDKYKDSQFTIPEFTLIKNGKKYYLTITTEVNKNDEPEQLAHKLREMKQRLLTESVNFPTGAHIIEKEEIKPEQWMNSIRLAREEIKNNQAKKIVLAREMRIKFNKRAEISAILKKLLDTQINSYVFAFEQAEDCFIGATPERLVKLEGEKLLSTCLAGTIPRGETAEEDTINRNTLLHDEKNLEEHDYVVKMIRNEIEDYCVDIVIPDEPIIYPLKNLHHLYTPVKATLKKEYSIFDIMKELHPTPALGGVPREKSLAFIREHELLDRGWYGSPIGWLDSNQNGEFAVAIRSGLIQGDEASLFAGCGIMKDSDLEAEYEETSVKFLPMLTALEAE